MSTKTCSRCKEEKDIDLFIKKRNVCKECAKQYNKKSKAKKANMDPETIVQCTTCNEKKKYALFVKGTKKCKDCDNKRRKENYEKKKANMSNTKTKFCSSCTDKKVETEFNPGFAICKVCQQAQKKARNEKHKQNLPDSKECKDCGLTQNIDQFRIGENVCYTCSKLKTYKWRQDNSEGFQKICERYRQRDDYREKQNAYKRANYKNNPIERLTSNYRLYLRNYIFKGIISKKIDKIVGLSQEQMKDWLEFNFKTGMSWDNYGTVWNLDHVIPCSSYDLEDEYELNECFSWKNTLPVYCKENLEKFDKVEDGAKEYMNYRAKMFMSKKNQQKIQESKIKKQKSEEAIELTDEIEDYIDSLIDSDDDAKPIKKVKKEKKEKTEKVKKTPKKEKEGKKKMKFKAKNFEIIKTVVVK